MLRGLLVSLCVVAGCGKVQVVGNNPDAPPIDADLHGLAHITVLDVLGNGALAPNVPVVFIDPDGTIAGDTTSDSNGRAEATILPGASVTVVYSTIMTSGATTTTSYLAGTVNDISPGDDLVFGFTDRDTTVSGNFNVSFPAPPGGATSYQIFTPCGLTSSSTAGTVVTQMQVGCKQDTFDVYVVALNASGVATQSAQLQNVSLATGAATIPNSWVPFSTFNSAYTDIPADASTVQVSRLSSTARGFGFFASCAPSNATCAMTGQVPTAGVKSLVRTTVGRNDTHMTQQVITQRVAGNSINYNLDVGTNLLPWMSDVTFDATAGTMTPALEAPDDQADMFFTEVSYTRDANTLLDWAVFQKTVGPTKFPTLPAHVGPVAPVATDTVTLRSAITIDSASVAGWDAARPRLFGLFEAAFFSNSDDDDLVRVQELQFSP